MERRRDMLPVTSSTVARMLAEIEIITENVPERLHYRNFLKFDDLEILFQVDEESEGNEYGIHIYSVDQNGEILTVLGYDIDPVLGKTIKYVNSEEHSNDITIEEMNEILGLLYCVGREDRPIKIRSSTIENLFNSTIYTKQNEQAEDKIDASAVLAETVERIAKKGQQIIDKRASFTRGESKYTVETSKIEGDTFAKVTIEPKLPGTKEPQESFTIFRDGKCKHDFDFPRGVFGVQSVRTPEVFKMNRHLVVYEGEALEFERTRLAPLVKRARS